MKAKVSWKDAMVFTGSADGHDLVMDAKSPIGKGSAPTPKELVILGMGGCTAMDVIALLKKYKQNPESFTVDLDVTPSEGKQPAVFEKAMLSYVAVGDIDPHKLLEAIQLSQTKYCGVGAMLSRSFPIHYRVELNGLEIGVGKATFNEEKML